MKLYSGVISPNGERVRICTTQHGIELEPALVDFQKAKTGPPTTWRSNVCAWLQRLQAGDAWRAAIPAR
jgi:hypothetical protein